MERIDSAEEIDVQVTKRKRVIARLVPEPVSVPAKLPDFKAQMRKIYGDKVFKISNAELIAEGRERF